MAKDEYTDFVKQMMSTPKVKLIEDPKDRFRYVAYLWKAKNTKANKDQYEYVNIGDPRPLFHEMENLSVNFGASIDEAAKGLGLHRTKFGLIAEAKLVSDLLMRDMQKVNDYLLTETFEHEKIKRELAKLETKHRIKAAKPKLPEDIKASPAPEITRDNLMMRSQAALDKLQRNLDSLKHNLS